jgi:hypothetical protein
MALALCLLTGCGGRPDVARPVPALSGDVVLARAVAFAEQMGYTNAQVMQDITISPTQQLIQVSWPVPKLSSEIPALFITVDRLSGVARVSTESEMKHTIRNDRTTEFTVPK